MTKTYGNFTDFVDFTRSSGGTALRRVSYGAELVTNGTFDTDVSEWTVSGGASPTSSVSSGQVVVTATQTGSIVFEQTSTQFEAGKLYQIKVDVIATTDNIDVWNKASSSISIKGLTTGTNVINYLATDNGYLRIGNLGSVFTSGEGFTLDNISVKEVTFDQSSGDLVLFNHPNNIPRVEYDSNGTVKGLLIEEARTNLVTYSEDFGTDAGWAWTRSTVTENTLAAPNGTTSADYLEQASGQTGAGAVGRTLTISGSGNYTWGVFAKAAEKPFLRVQLTGSNFAYFNLTTGVVGTAVGCTTSMIDFGNGWYRCSITASLSANPFALFYVGDADNSLSVTDSGGIYLWGGMFEAGSFPTSYIPTTGATATRSADIASIDVANFGYNKAAGTVVVDFDNLKFKSGGTGYPRPFELGSSVHAGERINVYVGEGTQNFSFGINTANAAQAGATLIAGVTSPFGPYKAGVAFKNNDAAAVETGGDVLVDTSVDITGTTYVRDTLQIGGSTIGATNHLNGHIRSIKYLPRKLTSTQLQEQTA